MATTKEYIDFVCGQIERYGEVHSRKMFGEYMAYLNEKPVLLAIEDFKNHKYNLLEPEDEE